MTAEAVAEGGSRDEDPAAPGGVPVLTGGAGPVAVRVFPGLAGQIREARRWVRALASRPGGPEPDSVELIVSELFANAVLHTRSGGVGGKVTVAVTADGVIHVHDYGAGGTCPGLAASPPSDEADCGRGLTIAAALCSGLAHMPAAWCPVAGPDDPAAQAGGCCTCCRPASFLPPVPPIPARPGETLPALSDTREESVLR